MGNTNSQSAKATLDHHNQWYFSFPRPPAHTTEKQQLVVLPDKDARQKLRSTNNGEILQSGGTLRRRSQQIKRCDSAPDLRTSPPLPNEHNDAIKLRKKYKAPSPPKLQGHKSAEWETVKKPRLFKTRLETKKINSSPTTNNKINHVLTSEENIIETKNNVDIKNRRLSHFELPLNFHNELKDTTANPKLTILKTPTMDEKSKLKTLDHNINNFKKIKKKLVTEELKMGKKNTNKDVNEEPKAKFYFGMDESQTIDDKIVFDFNIHTNQESTSSFESDLSSWNEQNDSQAPKVDIDLKLRPILPKKLLEVPRFSPAAAWKQLSSMNSDPNCNTLTSDDCPLIMEDRIEKYSRPPPPALQVARFSNDKSGDSGISGDAGPAGYEEQADLTLNTQNKIQISGQFNNNNNRTSWTPQQDLEDDSSMDEDLLSDSDNQPVKIGTKPHVFSLSLPRDNHLAAYILDKSLNSSDLKKLKRSVSGVLKNNNNSKDFTHPNLSLEPSDNWLLSKSAANSLTNGFNSLEMRHSQKSDDSKNNLVPLTGKQNSVRLMYLPEFDDKRLTRRNNKEGNCKESIRNRSRSADRFYQSKKLSLFSKSCENINGDSPEPGPANLQEYPYIDITVSNSPKKQKKFTFQSTMRQIERKKIAEKLSKEAERKEKQRLREVEAMRKVEEEFQKKRAREKAEIQQQLRFASLPPNMELIKEKIIPARSEADGASSSTATSSPALPHRSNKLSLLPTDTSDQQFLGSTDHSKQNSKKYQIFVNSPIRSAGMKTKILSDYKQPQRDYKEYRSPQKTSNNELFVHPSVQCNMPISRKKEPCTNKGQHNKRRDFT